MREWIVSGPVTHQDEVEAFAEAHADVIRKSFTTLSGLRIVAISARDDLDSLATGSVRVAPNNPMRLHSDDTENNTSDDTENVASTSFAKRGD